MKKIRFTFCRGKKATYLSHVEIEKIFIKAFNFLKDKMKAAYSHESIARPELDFALNLPISMESIGELAQISMLEEIKIPFFVKALNEVLPEGIAVLSASYVENDDNLKLYDQVKSVTYEIWFIYKDDEFKDKNKRQIEDLKKWYIDRMREFLSQDKIYLVRKSADRTERINIKPLIQNFSFMLDDSLIITIDAGQKSTLSPYDIMKCYNEYAGQYIEYNVRRKKIFTR